MHEDAEQRARAARDEAAAARDDAERRVAHAAVTARTKAIEEQSTLVREARAAEAYARIRLTAAENAIGPPAPPSTQLDSHFDYSKLQPVDPPRLPFGRGRKSYV